MRADVVIPVHNIPEDVQRCIESCIRSLRSEDQIILVDDGSTAPTEKICARAAEKHPRNVSLIRRPEGSGFCNAANAGIRLADAPIVILLNSDTVVPWGGWIKSKHALY